MELEEKCKVEIKNGFWDYSIDLVRNTILPYQWEVLNDRVPDAQPGHSVKNFRLAKIDNSFREDHEFE